MFPYSVMEGDGMNITYISMVSVPVKDQDKTKAFYVDQLGFKVLRDDRFGDRRWLQVGPAGGQTSVTLINEPGHMEPGSQKGIVLLTTDIQSDHKTLKSRGVAISDLARNPGGEYATFTDPDGNGWVLQQSFPKPRP